MEGRGRRGQRLVVVRGRGRRGVPLVAAAAPAHAGRAGLPDLVEDGEHLGLVRGRAVGVRAHRGRGQRGGVGRGAAGVVEDAHRDHGGGRRGLVAVVVRRMAVGRGRRGRFRRGRRRGRGALSVGGGGGLGVGVGVADVLEEDLHLSHLVLADLVVGVGDEVLPHLGEGVGDAGVRLGGRREGGDLDVQVLVEVGVLGVARVAQVLLLRKELKVWG